MLSRTELPRAWNWCTGENAAGPTPAWQAARLAAGDPLVPHLELFAHRPWSRSAAYATPGLEAARAGGLPLIFVYQNLFDAFRVRPELREELSADPATHPFLVRQSTGTIERRLSCWSNRIDYAWRLGWLLATSDYLRNAAALYPAPPWVMCADNGEAGVVDKQPDMLDDVRVPARIRRLEAAWVAASGETKDFLRGQLADVVADASRLGFAAHYSEFRRGFVAGLASHNAHWAAVAHWTMYGQAGNEYQVTEQDKLYQWGDYRYESVWGAPTGSDHAYRHDWGPTGQLYAQPWYGGFHVVRTVVQGENARYAMEQRELQGFAAPRCQLTWEGRDTELAARPSGEQWRGLVRYWLWTTHAALFGHFAESQTVVTDPRIATYYAAVVGACREVHDEPLLRDFWQQGELEPSTDPTPYEWRHTTHPALLGAPRRNSLLAVAEQDRWNPQGRDRWSLDRTRRQPVKVLALSVRHRDGRRLVYVAGLERAWDAVAVVLPDGAVRRLAAPLGGAWYLDP